MIMKFLRAAGSGLDKFLEFKNEASLTKKLTVLGVVFLTIGLATLSITGAFAKSSGDGGAWVGRLAYALIVLGLEQIAAVLFVRAMSTSDRLRQVVCFGIMIPLIWANVQNAKDGLRFIMPDTFGQSSAVLNAKADLAKEEAKKLTDTADTASASTPQELERVRSEIADREAFLLEMSAQTPEGIKQAQTDMISKCNSTSPVDGIRSTLTESAMRVCGERINRQLDTLRQREANLLTGAPPPVATASTNRRIDEIELRDKAAKAADAEIRAEVIFWISEFARQMLLWAAATSITAGATVAALRRMEELAEAEHQLALSRLRADPAPAAPPKPAEPVPVVEATPPPPEPPPEAAPAPPEPIEPLVLNQPEPAPAVERSDASQLARHAAKSLHKQRRADALEDVILVDDNRLRNAERMAAKEAAQ